MECNYKVIVKILSLEGKERIVVIAHDFPSESEEVRRIRMTAFRCQQPTTFEDAGFVMICGKLDEKVDMDNKDWDELVGYLKVATKQSDNRTPNTAQGEQKLFKTLNSIFFLL